MQIRPAHYSAALVIAALALSGCAIRSVHSYLGRGVDLRQYRLYSWDAPDRSATGDPRLDHNEIFQETVRAAVEQQLQARGFEKITAGAPDLLVRYHTSVEQKIDLTDRDSSSPCGADCRPFIYDAGTLVVDFLDARTTSLVWRGWADGNVDGLVDDQPRLTQQIDKAVARIFERVPTRDR